MTSKTIRFDPTMTEKEKEAKQASLSNTTTTTATTTPHPHPTSSTLRQLLESHRASDISYSGKPVVELTAGLLPIESAKTLWKNQILGAPVWDKKHKKYCGIFDLRDLLSIFLLAFERKQKEKEMGGAAAGEKKDVNTTWFPEDMNFTTSYLAARNPFVNTYNSSTSLHDLCKALIQEGVHIVPLVDPETGRCTRILSQSAMVKYIAEHVAKHHPAMEASLEQAKFPYQKKVLQAPDTASAQEVFALMDQHRLSGIAIVDHETGKLMGNTSASDIKTAVTLIDDEEVCADMEMDILSYLATVRQETVTKNDRYPSAHVHESSTVGHVIRLLAKTGFHRVFVVDQELKPIGVISVTDVLKFVVDNGPIQASEAAE